MMPMQISLGVQPRELEWWALGSLLYGFVIVALVLSEVRALGGDSIG